MSYIPQDDKQRKSLPLWRQVFRYFPKALREVTKVSVVNNVRYNPDRELTDISWNRGKSNDQLGSAFRHMLERAVDEKIFDYTPVDVEEKTGIERTYVLAAFAWRALAALELDIEEQEKAQQAPALQPNGWATHGINPRDTVTVESPLFHIPFRTDAELAAAELAGHPWGRDQ